MRSPWTVLGRVVASVFLVAGFLSSVVILPGSAWGQSVALQVQVIYAANQEGGVDSRLGGLAEIAMMRTPF